MNIKLSALMDIAKTVLPAIGSVVGDDKTGKVADHVAEIIKKVSKTDDADEVKAKLEDDPALRIELQKHLADLAHKETQEQNRAKEEERRQELEAVQRTMVERERQHQADLELVQQRLDSTNAARGHARELALSERWWVAGINPLLSLVITFAFLGFVYLIATVPIGGNLPESNENGEPAEQLNANADDTAGSDTRFNNEEVFYVAFGALATAFATVIGFHFGSSSGSKRKTQLRQFQNSPGQPNPTPPQRLPPGQIPGQQAPTRKEEEDAAAGHPFEAFWRKNLSHIEHFKWNELLYKGASNDQHGTNTDPPQDLYQNVVPLVNVLEAIRKEIGGRVRLLSVYRSPAYNKDINGAPKSRHMRFDAADFQVVDTGHGNSGNWAAIAKKLRDRGEFKGGIGIYGSFVHVDTRGHNADWDMR